jgi:hypothetical protein
MDLRFPQQWLWNTTPCIPMEVKRPFGGTYHLHLHRRSVCQVRKQQVELSDILVFL